MDYPYPDRTVIRIWLSADSVAEVWFSLAQTGNQTEKKTHGTRLAVHGFLGVVPE